MLGWLAKAFGRWADDTEKIARRIGHYLEPGESVLAAVFVQRPGTKSAAVRGGASAAVSAAVGAVSEIFASGSAPREDKRHQLWLRQAVAFGIDPQAAGRTIRLVVAVTTVRVLLVRRGYVTGGMHELLAAWQLTDIDRIDVPRNGNSLRLLRAGDELRCELPNAHRFIAQVYRDLPTIFDEARSAAQRAREH